MGEDVLAQCGVTTYSGTIETIDSRGPTIKYQHPWPNEICSFRDFSQIFPLETVDKIEITTGPFFWAKTRSFVLGQKVTLNLAGKAIEGEITTLTTQGLAQIKFKSPTNTHSDLDQSFFPLNNFMR